MPLFLRSTGANIRRNAGMVVVTDICFFRSASGYLVPLS